MPKTKRPPSPLRLRRLALGLTLDDVAKALAEADARVCGITAVHLWERGREVPRDVAPILARILKLRRLP